MCTASHIEFNDSMLKRVKNFYLTRPWGLGIEPLMLSKIFEKLESNAPKCTQPANRVAINTEVTLLDFQENQKVKLKIVSPALSHPEAGLVSFLSPLGAELIDKTHGDIINVAFLGNQMKFQLLEIH